MNADKSKLHIDPYVLRLVRGHILYIISFFVFVILTVFIIPRQLSDYKSLSLEAQAEEEKLVELQAQELSRAQFSQDVPAEVSVATLDVFLPSSEDFFSIFAALDTLAARAGLFIETFSPPFGAKIDEGALSIKVNAVGGRSALLELLEQYQYKSGRLITIDEIVYRPEQNFIEFTMNFHTKPVSQTPSKLSENQAELLSILKTIQAYYPQNISGDKEVSTDYGTNPDPFLQR
ncbi:MAG: hypothetical protein ACE5DQ_00335 [Candidatus Paceibacterota bacterium]